MTLISVVIPTKNRPHSVADAVGSVFAGAYQDFELFVIDQSAGTGTFEALATFHGEPRFHYARNRRPGVGAASSRNMGIALCNGEIVAIMDDDVTAQPDWLATIAAEFAADPVLQFICGKLTAPPFDWNEGFTPAFDPDEKSLSNWTMPIAAAGANFSMRRTLLDRVGGYDELCGPGSRLGAADDGDLAFRIARSGAKWKATSAVEVVHTHGFRPSADGAALLKRYRRGVGGHFGRFTRRGDLVAGLWFLGHIGGEAVRALLRAARRLERPSGLGWALDSLIGFWRGLTLPPGEGVVSGDDLRRLRARLRAEGTATHG